MGSQQPRPEKSCLSQPPPPNAALDPAAETFLPLLSLPTTVNPQPPQILTQAPAVLHHSVQAQAQVHQHGEVTPQPAAHLQSPPTSRSDGDQAQPGPRNPNLQQTSENDFNTSSVRFPTTAVRQRNTNINLANAENEFQKTALDSCRSTIVQQETEIKRLKETLSIRNRRIMQLEEQIKHAGDYIASRDSAPSVDNSKINESLIEKIWSKLASHPPQVTNNNIYVNSAKVTNTSSQSKDSQTDMTGCICGDNQTSSSSASSTNLTGSSYPHQASSSAVNCDFCERTFSSATDLRLHMDQDHVTIDNVSLPQTL